MNKIIILGWIILSLLLISGCFENRFNTIVYEEQCIVPFNASPCVLCPGGEVEFTEDVIRECCDINNQTQEIKCNLETPDMVAEVRSK